MRFPIYITDATGAGVAGLTLTGTQVKTSVDGATLANAGGTVAPVGSGAYTYSAAGGDLGGKLLVLRVADGVNTAYVFTTSTPVVADFAAGTTGAARYVPVYVVDSAGVPVTGAVPSAGQIQVSIDGASWVNGAGSWHELGSGAYYYDPATAEVAVGGLLMVKVTASWPVIVAVRVGDPAPAVVAAPSPIAAPSATTDPEYVDHTTRALARLPEQFRRSQ